jgi:hypothetical protein
MEIKSRKTVPVLAEESSSSGSIQSLLGCEDFELDGPLSAVGARPKLRENQEGKIKELSQEKGPSKRVDRKRRPPSPDSSNEE